MNLQKPFTVIALTALITTFTMTSFALDHEDEGGKHRAKKDKGETLTSHVRGCTLNITNSDDVILYSDRSLQGVPIAKVPIGKYEPLEYTFGWYKIRAQGWIAWIQDPAVEGVKKSAILKSNCPGENKVVGGKW